MAGMARLGFDVDEQIRKEVSLPVSWPSTAVKSSSTARTGGLDLLRSLDLEGAATTARARSKEDHGKRVLDCSDEHGCPTPQQVGKAGKKALDCNDERGCPTPWQVGKEFSFDDRVGTPDWVLSSDLSLDGASWTQTGSVSSATTPTTKCKMKVAKSLSFRDASVLRGARVADVLARGAPVLSDKPCPASYYMMSSEVDHCGTFISHNWGTPRFDKFLVLALYFNTRAAFLSSTCVGLLFMVLTIAGLLPAFQLSDGGDEWQGGFSCQVAGYISFMLVFLFWPDIGRLIGYRGESVFLDKVCVHQTDEDMKRRGIEHLAAFLHYSWSMLICYSDTYLQRLWTVYEVATFMMLHAGGCVHVRPLILPKVVLGSMTVTSVYMLAWQALRVKAVRQFFLDKLGSINPDLLQLALVWVAAVAACIFIHKMAASKNRIAQKVESFRIDQAQCLCEADRVSVQSNITAFMKFHHHVTMNADKADVYQAFEAMVREKLPQLFAASMGRVGVSYRLVMSMLIPYLFFVFDTLGAWIHEGTPTLSMLTFTARHAAQAFALFPLTIAIVGKMSDSCIRADVTVWYSIQISFLSAIFLAMGYGGQSSLKALGNMANEGSEVALVGLLALCALLGGVTMRIYRPIPYVMHERRLKDTDELMAG